MRNIFKKTGLLIAAPFFMVLLYLVAALIGGLVPSGIKQSSTNNPLLEKSVYLTTNALHADIAIPVNAISLQQFAFLQDAGFPLDNSNLEYLIIGWGSREFYTSTANYSDMKLGTVWTAVTGDEAVMHVAPTGDIRKSEGAVKVEMTQSGFENMIAYILDSFKRSHEKPVLLKDATFGYGDLFYEAEGRFNIFNPCNVWVSSALEKAGVSAGIWTPTTYSLLLHHRLYN